MARMMLYFEVCRASYGAVSWEYLETVPVEKLSFMVRAARAVNIINSIDTTTAMNTAFSGNKKSFEKMQRQLDNLLFIKPTTDVDKLKSVKQKFRKKQAAKKAAMASKPGKRRPSRRRV